MTTDPTHLGALETGYELGHTEAVIALRNALAAGTDPARLVDALETSYSNPHTKLFDDRREYVREQVTDAFGGFYDEDGDELFDQTDFVDAILDANADWMVAHTPLVRRTFAGIDLDLAGIDDLRDRPMIDSVLAAYVAFRDADAARRSHASDCALHSEPAGAARPCDCANRSASNEDTKPETSQATCGHAGIALTTSEGEICTVVCALRPGHDGPHEDGLTGVQYVDAPTSQKFEQ